MRFGPNGLLCGCCQQSILPLCPAPKKRSLSASGRCRHRGTTSASVVRSGRRLTLIAASQCLKFGRSTTGSQRGGAVFRSSGLYKLAELEENQLGPDFSRLADAHGHPQLDPLLDNDMGGTLEGIRAVRLALMSVSHADWPLVDRACQQMPSKCIPCYGIHPWWSHLHASAAFPCREGMLTGRKPKHLAEAEAVIGNLPDPVPLEVWESELNDRLRTHPRAIVGEVGLDKAAVVLGTRVSTCMEHQMELLQRQLSAAASWQRPISIHCVRAYGGLLQLLSHLPPDSWPPKLMLHSYGGSVDMIRQFTHLAGGLGDRIYFSFNSAVNSNFEKMRERLRHVPDDRLLIESDLTRIDGLDDGLVQICHMVARSKTWPVQHAADRTFSNFNAFYEGFLP